MGVSHSGQLHRTVNPTASAYGSSNLPTPTLFSFRNLRVQEILADPVTVSQKGRQWESISHHYLLADITPALIGERRDVLANGSFILKVLCLHKSHLHSMGVCWFWRRLAIVDVIAAIVIKCSDSSTSEVKAWIDEDANLVMEIPADGSKSRLEISMAETQKWIKNWKLQNRTRQPA